MSNRKRDSIRNNISDSMIDNTSNRSHVGISKGVSINTSTSTDATIDKSTVISTGANSSKTDNIAAHSMPALVSIPKGLTQFKKIIGRYRKVSFFGLDVSFYPTVQTTRIGMSGRDSAHDEVLFDTRKIREYQNILMTPHTCIIGINSTIEQLVLLIENDIEYPLLRECLGRGFSVDMWQTTLFQAIFGRKSVVLLRLFLILTNAQVQCMRENILEWLSFRDIFSKKIDLVWNKSIPIKIRINLYDQSHHTILSSIYRIHTVQFPHFEFPTIMGQILLGDDKSSIEDIQLLYYYKRNLVLLTPFLNKSRVHNYPMSLLDVKDVYQQIPHTRILKSHLPYVLQSLVALLAPHFE